MRQRSCYPKPFKAQVVHESLQPGATISSVAIHHGINANVIRKWLPSYRGQSVATLRAFFSVNRRPSAPEDTLIISPPLGDKSITVKWPASDPDGCACFIRGLPNTSRRCYLARRSYPGHTRRHCAYLFANRRANRMKVLVHDGVGIWLVMQRLNQGKFSGQASIVGAGERDFRALPAQD